MSIDYGLHTLRLNRQYDARTRRALERFKEAVDTLWDELGAAKNDIDVLEGIVGSGGSGVMLVVDADYFNIDGATGENLAIPTALGQVFIRISNKVVSAGTHTITFLTNDLQMPVGGGTKATIATTGAGSYLVLLSAYIGDVYRWYALHSAGWS